MADLKFEGDLNGASERQIEYIRSVLEKRGYKNEKVLFETVGETGDGYVATVKRIIVEKDGVTFKMIAKIAPFIVTLRMSGNTAFLFQNEHYMYTKVLPKITDMLKAAEVPEHNRLRYAVCYGTFLEEPNEVILLEDLKESDFVMLDRFKSLSNDTVKLVLKNLAILHSASFALKKQEPETFEEFKSNLIHVWYIMQSDEKTMGMFAKFEDDILSVLDDKYKKLVKGSMSQMGQLVEKNCEMYKESRFSVIDQGDPWTNNIMFKIEGDKTVDCCMIDYQGSKVSSPVGDIQYMIFNCTDYETRSKHFHDWIDYYHSELDKSLAYFDLKAIYVYPRDQLDIDLMNSAKFSFCSSMIVASAIIRESGDAVKLKNAMVSDTYDDNLLEEAKISSLDDKSVLRFKSRVQGILDSFLELGYFKK